MKYTVQKSRTVYEDIEIEVPDGISYFKTFNEDDEPESYYRLSVEKHKNFDTLYNIIVTRLLNYSDKYHINYSEYCEGELPYYLRVFFRGEKENKKEEITEDEFHLVKQQILSKF